MNNYPYYYNEELGDQANRLINAEIMKYAGMYLLKKIDIAKKSEGGIVFEVPLKTENEYLEPILDDLLFNDLLEINIEKTIYELTEKGREYVDKLIEEIETYIDKYADFEPQTRVSLLRKDRVNPLRVRFLWGLYDGEFDDLNRWQENLNIDPKERIDDWRFIITKKDFYDILFEEINNMEECDNEDLNRLLLEAKQEREVKKIEEEKQKEEKKQKETLSASNNGNSKEETVYYYDNPNYFNPLYDPLFWFIVF